MYVFDRPASLRISVTNVPQTQKQSNNLTNDQPKINTVITVTTRTDKIWKRKLLTIEQEMETVPLSVLLTTLRMNLLSFWGFLKMNNPLMIIFEQL